MGDLHHYPLSVHHMTHKKHSNPEEKKSGTSMKRRRRRPRRKKYIWRLHIASLVLTEARLQVMVLVCKPGEPVN